jgi:hypothetical protein
LLAFSLHFQHIGLNLEENKVHYSKESKIWSKITRFLPFKDMAIHANCEPVRVFPCRTYKQTVTWLCIMLVPIENPHRSLLWVFQSGTGLASERNESQLLPLPLSTIHGLYAGQSVQ